MTHLYNYLTGVTVMTKEGLAVQHVTIETDVYRGSRRHRPIVGSVKGHWTTDLSAAIREGASILNANKR